MQTGETNESEREYILGTDAAEDTRLGFQHEAWLAYAQRAWARAGVGPGQTVLDLGCGPGYATFELAKLVSGSGRVIARDVSQRFLDAIDRRCRERGIENVATSAGPAEDLDVPAGSIDAVYSRWLLCWLEDPGVVLHRIARVLKPGGRAILQDYLDWGGMSLLPPDPTFDRGVAACIASFAASGADIDVGKRLPALARAAGLEVEVAEPIARIGAVGSPEWRWLGEFFRDYLPKVVAEGRLDPATAEAFAHMWRARTEAAESYVHTPLVLDLLLSKR